MPPSITICCQLFYPELISTGQTITELAQALAAKRVRISVLCAQPSLLSTDKLPADMTLDPITIRRLPSTRFSKSCLLGKLCNHVTFGVSLMLHLLKSREKGPLMVLTNPPFLLGCVGLVAWIRRRRLILVMFDLYPDTAIACGFLNAKGLLAKIWRRFNQLGYHKASHIVVLGRCMASVLKPQLHQKDQAKLRIIPIWSHDATQKQPVFPNPYRQKWGLEEKFVVLYSGNMGRFHDMETLIEASILLKNEPHIRIVFVGHGHKRSLVSQDSHVYDHVPQDELPNLLACADVGLVSLMPQQLGLSVPSKTVGLLTAGVPVIAVIPPCAEMAQVLVENNCGWVVKNGEAAILANLIRALSKNKKEVETKKSQALLTAKRLFSLSDIADAYMELFDIPWYNQEDS